MQRESEENSVQWDPRKLAPVQIGDFLMHSMDGIIGFHSLGEIEFFINLADRLPVGGRYLEIGSFLGLSAVSFALSMVGRGNSDGTIFCVDTWQGSIEHDSIREHIGKDYFDKFVENIRRSGFSRWIRPLKGSSTEVVSLFRDQSLDIIFIDGDHTFEGALADMRNWWPKLKQGGIFLGHDAIPDENLSCGVRSALGVFCREQGVEATIHEPPLFHYLWEISKAGE